MQSDWPQIAAGHDSGLAQAPTAQAAAEVGEEASFGAYVDG
jgi:hypothetical protein